MALDGTYETKLLRLLIGLLHISVTEQRALVRHSKPFHSLTAEEKLALQDQIVADALKIAEQLSEAGFSTTSPPMSLDVN